LQRNCPNCSAKMDVFDEECPACKKPSKPGALLTIAGIIHGWRKVILLAAILTLAWIIMEKLFK
jgi:predicted amidophosphoribosyltransferase